MSLGDEAPQTQPEFQTSGKKLMPPQRNELEV